MDTMTDAVADTRGEIANAFDRLQDISDTLIASLKQAALDFFDLPYLDPEDIRSLHYTATVFEKIPDFADALDHSAHGLVICRTQLRYCGASRPS